MTWSYSDLEISMDVVFCSSLSLSKKGKRQSYNVNREYNCCAFEQMNENDNRQTIHKIEMLWQGSQDNTDLDDLEFIWADLRKGVKSVIQSNQQGGLAIYKYKKN